MTFNETFTKIEKAFNIAGGIPIVGIVSGSLRAMAATIQAVVAFLFAAFSMVAQLIDSANAGKWEERASLGLEHMIHGGLNYLRAIGEVFTSTLAVPLIVQLCREDKFEPVFKYGQGFVAQPELAV